MAVGNLVTIVEFNRVLGEICQSAEELALAVEDVKAVLDTKTAAEWATQTGIAEADINTALSAINDLAQLVNLYQGETTLAVAKDFRVFVRQCRGLSAII